MFVKLGGKFLTVAGKYATSLACCCGFDPKKWYCLLSSDGSYRCAQEYDIEQDQMLSEHSSKEDCERFCGQDKVYCYYDDKIGYYCTDYFDEGYLSGPYPDTITCNEACKQMWFCVDKGSGGGETQYECVLQDPSEDYLSGPYGSKEACEYRCGDLWWCTYKYINTDEYEYECVKDNTGAPDNAVSGPYGSDAECDVVCPPEGRCCIYPFRDSGPQPANTAEEAIELASQSARANSAAIEGSIWKVGYFSNGQFFEDEALFDEERDQYTCNGVWTTGDPAECSVTLREECGIDQPFAFWDGGVTCEEPCPDNPPQPDVTPGVCLTRPSESGSCEYWDFDGRAPFEFDTESEAAAARDAGNQQTLINPETGQPMQSQVGWIYQNTSNGKWYYDAVWLLDDGSGNAYREEDSRTTDQGFCESILVPICPAGNCDPADVQDQAEAMIDNHYVYWDAYECNVVASEEECTGIDAQFCPDLTECPSDFSGGCPETPIRNLPTFDAPP